MSRAHWTIALLTVLALVSLVACLNPQPLPPGHRVEGMAPPALRPVCDVVREPRDAGAHDASRSR
ncbi:MAG TPA: hypothetical protein VGG39_37710 [Polyangiaceae bacterium]|jgi:hypothetical protein